MKRREVKHGALYGSTLSLRRIISCRETLLSEENTHAYIVFTKDDGTESMAKPLVLTVTMLPRRFCLVGNAYF